MVHSLVQVSGKRCRHWLLQPNITRSRFTSCQVDMLGWQEIVALSHRGTSSVEFCNVVDASESFSCSCSAWGAAEREEEPQAGGGGRVAFITGSALSEEGLGGCVWGRGNGAGLGTKIFLLDGISYVLSYVAVSSPSEMEVLRCTKAATNCHNPAYGVMRLEMLSSWLQAKASSI